MAAMWPSLRISTWSQHSSTSRSRCEERIRWSSPWSRISWMSRIMRWRAGGSRPLVGSSRNSSLRAVHDGLRQLGQLLHAERIGAQVAVARLAQADVEERFVRALEACSGGRPASSAISRTNRTPLISAMKASFSGM